MRVLVVLLGCAALGVGAAAASGQTIHGTVRDQVTGRSVATATVKLVQPGGRSIAETVSDSAGAFELEPDLAGSYTLRLEALGYRGRDAGPVSVGYGELVEVTVELAAEALPLPPLVVTARSHPPNPYLTNAGFYERRKAGQGIYLTREEIMQRDPAVFSDLMRTIAGMSVQPDAVTGRRGASTTMRSNGRCQPVLILDGAPTLSGGANAARGRDMPLDDLLEPRAIEGLELYRGSATIPPQFNINAAGCGVLVVWTRRR